MGKKGIHMEGIIPRVCLKTKESTLKQAMCFQQIYSQLLSKQSLIGLSTLLILLILKNGLTTAVLEDVGGCIVEEWGAHHRVRGWRCCDGRDISSGDTAHAHGGGRAEL